MTARINDRLPPEEDIERIETEAGRGGGVLQDGVSESGEQAGLRAGLAGGDEVAPAGGGKSAGLGVPHDEVAEDSYGAVGIERLATPAKRDANLVPVVGREGRIGKGVVIVPDGELVESFVAVRGVDLDYLDVGVRAVESGTGAGSVARGPGEPDLVTAPGGAYDAEPGERRRLRQPVAAILGYGSERAVGPVIYSDIAPRVRRRILAPAENLKGAVVLVAGPVGFIARVLRDVAGVGSACLRPVRVTEIDRAARRD